MAENNENVTLTLDGQEVTMAQLQEAKQNKAVRIIEDKEHPGQWRTLKKLNETAA